jgi:LysR family glycine cleavage system transcriptional activator
MLPPLSSLRAFEAVARHGGVGRAASDLGVSQPAVSQQLRRLEAALGVRLIRRSGREIVLTAEGRAYAQALGRAFDELRLATLRCRARRGAGVLTVAMLPTLATRWLIPRLPDFQARHPAIAVRIATTPSPAVALADDVDLAIRTGDGAWPGCDAVSLMPDDLAPVASPALLARLPLAAPADLRHHTLLVVATAPRDRDWPRWLEAAGLPAPTGTGRLALNSSSEALEAAKAGLGVALAHRPFADDDLAAGRLVPPLALAIAGDGAYWAVCRREDAADPRIGAFRAWLQGQAAASGAAQSA